MWIRDRLKLEAEEKPDEVAVAFDLKAPTFRHKMYSGYKAQRKGCLLYTSFSSAAAISGVIAPCSVMELCTVSFWSSSLQMCIRDSPTA